MSKASAPGRVNLIGEHTDYQGGFVMPAALPLRITVEIEPRADRRIVATSRGETLATDLDSGPTGTWIDHVIGPAKLLGLERGYDADLSSHIPMGAGLGSSGALGVAMVRALSDAFGLGIDDLAVARIAQRSENEFAGTPSGILDQMAASLARASEALLVDCRSLEFERIRVPQAFEIVVIDSGQRHEHRSGSYADRRRECEAAARMLGVAQLRDVPPGDLARVDALPEPLRRRAHHVVMENARVIQAAVALRTADVVAFGAFLDASHISLRDDFEVSTPEIDVLVDLVREQDGVHGARIQGGGFGGSIVAIADEGAGHHAAARAVADYVGRTGLAARTLIPPIAL
ncbi:MAG: galactokinase [Chloroflexi bacterium]|nr:galactokinase [Chloroflexota bacterium]